MSLLRIQFADNSIGTQNVYTLPYNPTSVEWPDDDLQADIGLIDSETAIQKAYWDGRPILLVWKNFAPSVAGFTTMLGVLRGYIGDKKYINLRDIDTLVISDATAWKGPYRVANVTPKLKDGPGKIWDSITLVLLPTTA